MSLKHNRPYLTFLLLLGAVSLAGGILAGTGGGDRAKEAYEGARVRYQLNGGDSKVAWELARACFDWAEFVGSDEVREAVAQEGIEASRRAVSLDPESAAGRYYLALNLGQLARTKRVGALALVKEMERELKLAIALDGAFDYAGPHRALGLLYLQAPGWPLSIGDAKKARTHLEKAAALSPEYPENRIELLNGYLKWKKPESIRAEVQRISEIWPELKEKFSGEQWEDEWLRWDEQWASAREAAAPYLKAR